MGWIIAASIVLFFALLLAGRVVVYFDYNNDLAVKIKYLCFTIVKIPKMKKKRKKPKKAKKKVKGKKGKTAEAVESDKESSGSAEDKKDKAQDKAGKKKASKKKNGEKKKKFDLKSLTFDDMIELLKMALSGVGKPLKKLFKSIVFSHMSIRIVVGGSDAAQTAIKFGAINIAAGNALGMLDSFFTLKTLEDMNITADFQSEKTLYDVYFEVRLTLFAALVAAIRLVKVLLKLNKTYKQKQEKNSRT